MVDTPTETAAKIQAAAKDVVSASGDFAHTVIDKTAGVTKEGARRSAELARGVSRTAEEALLSANETTAASVRATQNATAEGIQAATRDAPAAIRDATERGVVQIKEAYSRFRKAAEDTTGLVEESYASTTRGFSELQLKLLDNVKQNTGAMFDHWRDLMGARAITQVVELQTAFARRQMEAFTAQAKDVSAIAGRLTTDAARPVRVGLERSADTFRRSA